MSFFGQSTPSFGSFGQQQPAQQQQQQPSLFGQQQPAQQQQQQQQGTSLFGAQPAKPSLFTSFGTQPSATGSTPAAPTTTGFGSGGGLFGSQSAAPAGGGLFGSTTQQPAAGGGLFGNSQQPAQPATGGGLFGSTSQQPSSLFGNQQQQQQQQQPGTSSLFGATPAGGGGLFGSSTSGTPSAGLFGSSTTPAAGAGGGLFGSTTSAPSGGGLFGLTPAAPSGGGLFGSSTAAPPSGGGLFGSSTAAAPQGGGLFGSSTSAAPGSSLFGQPQQQQQQQQQQQPFTSSIFGQSSNAPSTGLFTSNAPSFLGSTRPNGVAAGQADPAAQHAALGKQIEGIMSAWNTSSPDCAFQYFFYNLVDPAQVALYRRPDNWTNTALWERAVRENPDPTCMVPVLALGFDDLQRRVAAQDKTQSEHSAKLKELSTRLEALSQKHVLSNAVRIARARSLQAQLSARLIRLVQHLHLLIPSVRSSAIRPEEEVLRAALEAIEDELKKPGGMGRVRGKLNELWALLGAVSAQRERERRARPDGSGWAVADEDGLQRITQILKEQQHGLAHITNILRDDLRDVAIMESGGTAAALPSSASFNASQNSLAASMMLRR